MARSRTALAPRPSAGLDKAAAPEAQGARAAQPSDVTFDDDSLMDDWSEGAVHRGRLRVRTLVTLRWLVAAGEVLLLIAAMALRFEAPYPLCFAVVAAGAWANLLTGVASPGQRIFGDREATAQLSIDILQISALV